MLRAQGKYAEAEPLFRRAVGITEAALGARSPATLRPLNNLAGLLQDTNRLAEAEPLYRRALEHHGRGIGREHPGVARP